MPVLQGTTSSSFEQDPAYNIPCKIISWYLCNNGASDIDASISVFHPATSTTNVLYFKNILAYSAEFSSVPFILLPGDKILINTTGAVNYYISIE
jgi:hypothetical protein